jgi:hypothetical protein
MRRVLLLVPLLALVGCRAAAERVVLQQLPDDAGPMPYTDLVSRARLQAMAANEAFYVDRWPDVEDAARGLEQSARFLKQATLVPAERRSDLSLRTDRLAADARQLRDAAKARDVERTNSTLQRIHLQIRELR